MAIILQTPSGPTPIGANCPICLEPFSSDQPILMHDGTHHQHQSCFTRYAVESVRGSSCCLCTLPVDRDITIELINLELSSDRYLMAHRVYHLALLKTKEPHADQVWNSRVSLLFSIKALELGLVASGLSVDDVEALANRLFPNLFAFRGGAVSAAQSVALLQRIIPSLKKVYVSNDIPSRWIIRHYQQLVLFNGEYEGIDISPYLPELVTLLVKLENRRWGFYTETTTQALFSLVRFVELGGNLPFIFPKWIQTLKTLMEKRYDPLVSLHWMKPLNSLLSDGLSPDSDIIMLILDGVAEFDDPFLSDLIRLQKAGLQLTFGNLTAIFATLREKKNRSIQDPENFISDIAFFIELHPEQSGWVKRTFRKLLWDLPDEGIYNHILSRIST